MLHSLRGELAHRDAVVRSSILTDRAGQRLGARRSSPSPHSSELVVTYIAHRKLGEQRWKIARCYRTEALTARKDLKKTQMSSTIGAHHALVADDFCVSTLKSVECSEAACDRDHL